ncbi:hypothetical protein KIW84_014377 [Lathyrus oleraceus]|uniref:Uncharacterized protein n=1 Tax=Pisum sativum TaxID=3888 RepID=A0A9D5BMK6_PEA|nr:hypothetical protein KIW84_014377 [Pisum sativum]
MIGIDQSPEEHQVLVVRRGQRKNYDDQYGRSFQPRDMSFVKFHYCQQFGHKQSRCPEFVEDVRNIKKKIRELKSAPSPNMVSCEDDILACENEGEFEVKRF